MLFSKQTSSKILHNEIDEKGENILVSAERDYENKDDK
tara:strand:+ start:2505 stop:2618 length:114 start_codon:yes stop_codon:yes gene_type:complete